MKKRRALLVLAALLTVSALAVGGCGKKEKKESKESGVKTIKLATTPDFKPFVYKDDEGNLKGYEVELAQAVFDKLPQYKLEFEFTEWQSVLTGLDSGMYQISAESIFYTDERAEKYYYSDPILYDPVIAVTAADAPKIESLDDLQGRTIQAQAGDVWANIAEKYNKDHPGKEINVNYTEVDRRQFFSDIEAGKYSALMDLGYYLGITADVDLNIKKYDMDPEKLKEYFSDSNYTYFLLSRGKDSDQLLKDVNGALKEVMEDGTAKKLSEKYFEGRDLTPIDNPQ